MHRILPPLAAAGLLSASSVCAEPQRVLVEAAVAASCQLRIALPSFSDPDRLRKPATFGVSCVPSASASVRELAAGPEEAWRAGGTSRVRRVAYTALAASDPKRDGGDEARSGITIRREGDAATVAQVLF